MLTLASSAERSLLRSHASAGARRRMRPFTRGDVEQVS